jgi:hypothetical protein
MNINQPQNSEQNLDQNVFEQLPDVWEEIEGNQKDFNLNNEIKVLQTSLKEAMMKGLNTDPSLKSNIPNSDKFVNAGAWGDHFNKVTEAMRKYTTARKNGESAQEIARLKLELRTLQSLTNTNAELASARNQMSTIMFEENKITNKDDLIRISPVEMSLKKLNRTITKNQTKIGKAVVAGIFSAGVVATLANVYNQNKNLDTNNQESIQNNSVVGLND